MAVVHKVDGNVLTLLKTGQERLDALIALIDGARESLRLLYYIFADDAAGWRVRDALIAAAKRGIRVRLVIDGFGSRMPEGNGLIEPLRTAGVDLCIFTPHWGRRYLLRNHQKLALADECRVIIGGFNIADPYFVDSGMDHWRDLGLIVEGPAAQRLTGYYDRLADWTRKPKPKMRSLRRALGRWSEQTGSVQWLLGGPALRLSPWARAIRHDLKRGRDVSIVAAYFAPSPALLRRIGRVGRSGTARVLTASMTDVPTTVSAARFTFPGLMRRQVRVYEYVPSRLHTKLYVIDDAVHIGSANFDMRSLFLNFEIMLRINDAEFAATMRRYVDGELSESRERHLEEFTGIGSIPDRVRNAFCYFLVAVLDYNLSRRLNRGAD